VTFSFTLMETTGFRFADAIVDRRLDLGASQ
jgi:hypothetical protein